MSVPTNEEMVEAALRAKFTGTYNPAWDELLTTSPAFVAGERKKMRTILSAVLDRLKPVVAEAIIEANGLTQYSIGRTTADARATRIIDKIKGA